MTFREFIFSAFHDPLALIALGFASAGWVLFWAVTP